MNSKNVWIFVFSFIVLLLADLFVMLPVRGEVAKLSSPPGVDFNSYYDPVDLKIQELRKKGLTDIQIVSELEKIGMHWDIERNITSTGTPDFDKNDPHYNENSQRDSIERCSVLGTNDHIYSAYYIEMKAGSLAVGSGETDLHYVTTHLGTDPSGYMAEVGIKRNLTGIYFFSNFQVGEEHDVWIHNIDLGNQIQTPITHFTSM